MPKEESSKKPRNKKKQSLSSTFDKKKSLAEKQVAHPHQLIIKEITDGVGNVKNPNRSLETFKRTTRDYQVNLQ